MRFLYVFFNKDPSSNSIFRQVVYSPIKITVAKTTNHNPFCISGGHFDRRLSHAVNFKMAATKARNLDVNFEKAKNLKIIFSTTDKIPMLSDALPNMIFG